MILSHTVAEHFFYASGIAGEIFFKLGEVFHENHAAPFRQNIVERVEIFSEIRRCNPVKRGEKLVL